MKYREEFEKCYAEVIKDEFQIVRPYDTFTLDQTGNNYLLNDIRLAYQAFVLGMDRYKTGIPIGELMAIFEKKKVKERTGMDFPTFAQCPLEAMLFILTPSPQPIDLGLGDLAPVLGQAFGMQDWQAQATAAGMARQEKSDAADKSAG